MKIILVLLLTVLPIISTLEASVKHPVLLAPGFLSSKINAKYVKEIPNLNCGKLNETQVLWLNIFKAINYKCLLKSLTLQYDKDTHTTKDQDFIKTSIPGFGVVDNVENYLYPPLSFGRYFYATINTLEKLGYKRNIDIKGVPYDFRKGLYEMDNYFKSTIKLIETMYKQSDNKSVMVVGHSMGNLMLNYILNNAESKWKQKYIKGFISISAPYIGTAEVVVGILSGTFGNKWYLPQTIDQKVLASWPSAHQMIPQASFWNKEPIVFTKNHGNFTTNQMQKLLKISKRENAATIYKDTLDRINFNHITNAPNVPVYCVYSVGLKTLKQFDYRNVKFPDEQPDILYGNGDGTVNIESLKHCEQWKKKQKQPVSIKVFDNVNHVAIMNSKLFLNEFEQIIKSINQLK